MRQPDLNFVVSAPELFAGPEMGEDALRVLGEYLKLHERIAAEVQAVSLGNSAKMSASLMAIR